MRASALHRMAQLFQLSGQSACMSRPCRTAHAMVSHRPLPFGPPMPRVSSTPCIAMCTSSATSSPATHTEPAALTLTHGVHTVPPDFPGEEQLPFYSQFPLNRMAHLRRDTERLSELFSSDSAILVPLSRDKVLVQRQAGVPGLTPVLLSPAAAIATKHTASGSQTIFLGQDASGAPFFAVEISEPLALLAEARAALAASQTQTTPQGTSSTSTSTSGQQPATVPQADIHWLNARVAGTELAPGDAALLAVASGLGQWHATNGYDPATGLPRHSVYGGHARNTGQPRARSAYPRIDPAVIMLITAGASACTAHTAGSQHAAPHMLNDWCLLGRKAEWPAGRYSTLAGFMEVGEPLELAVARETYEESGVTVELPSIHYAASQPWPFPRSLMVGFYASAAPADQQRPPVASLRKAQQTSSSSAAAAPGTAQNRDGNGNGSGAASSSHTGQFQGADGAPAPPAAAHWVPPAGARGYDLLPTDGRRAAIDVGLTPQEVEQVMAPVLPPVHTDTKELEDCRWFHRDWLRARLLSPHGANLPGSGDFQIPGRWSLAYRLINTWLHQGHPPPPQTPSAVSLPATASSSSSSQPASSQHTPASMGAEDGWAGDAIPQVAIDEGVFKYVLMRLRNSDDPTDGRQKLLVWGDTGASYHMDVYRRAKTLAAQQGLTVEPLGGGRMEHYSDQKVVFVYGYSGAFGAAPHEVTAALIRKWYPLYDAESVTVSYQGY